MNARIGSICEPERTGLCGLMVPVILICCIITGCQPSTNDVVHATTIVEKYTTQSESMDGNYFGRMPADNLGFLVEELEKSRSLVKQSDGRAFMPLLNRYPGWFDFGLASRAGDDDIYVYLDGRVRIFRTGEGVFVLILSERSNAITQRVVVAGE